MKKYLLLLLTMLCVSIGAWADLPSGLTVTDNNPTVTISSTTAGLINSNITDISNQNVFPNYRSRLKITGNINQDDIDALKTIWSNFGNDDGAKPVIDFSEAVLASGATISVSDVWKGVIVPSEYELNGVTGTNVSYVAGIVNSSSISLYITKNSGFSDCNAVMQSKLFLLQNHNITYSCASGVDKNSSEFTTGKAAVESAVGNSYTVTEIVPPSNDPYTVDGCNVSINMNKAGGKSFSTLLSEAKAAMTAADATQTHICTLIVTGPVTNNDLIALGGTNMTGATRIDLSGATLGSGVTIDNIQLPATLEQLVLPKDQMFSVGLKSKLTAATNLNYAYTPSSDCTATGPNQADESDPTTYKYDDTKNTIADYVWVNKADGLKQAFENEEQLRNSFYIKVASSVALTETDVNFNGCTNKPTNYLFLDFSESNLTPAVAASYKVTDQIGYRIILPNDWSLDDMAVFVDNTNRGSLAAVYSYSGTTMKILEITDGSYSQTALKNPRIVRRGTTAIEVVGENTDKSGEWKQYGNLGNNLIAALNQADDDTDDEGNPVNNIKSITINIGTAAPLLGDISFTNTNIETLAFIGVKNKDNSGTGPSLTVTGCTSLTTLDVSNSTLRYLDAHGLTSLTSVNMNGTLVTTANEGTGTVNLSSTGLRTLTTNSSTDIKGSLNLAGSTALTSFATQAKITGDISLNACSSLTSLDISGTQFQNSNSKIHVHATDSESDNNVLSGLNNGTNKTILLPAPVNNVHFDQDRIHPNTDLEDNMAEAATSGEGSNDSDQCYIEYDADTKTATAHINTAGHLADLLYSSYASYPEGTTFKFAAGSQINEYDLEALAGYIKKTDNTEADYNWRTNYYYVDLYDLTATDALCNNTTGVIGKTIKWLRTNDRQFKGLILPKDHTLYGSGISLIQGEIANTAGQLSTCSEFIAYYKTKEIKQGASEASDLTKTILFTHVYNQTATNSEGIQASNDKLTELLTAHGLNGAGANAADLYSVSTNGTTPFNATALVDSKGYIETFNNEMVGAPTQANIYAYPKAAGEYTTFVGSSSIGVTPTEVLKIAGTVSNDASAVATAFNTFANGPRVLDLSEITPNDDTFLKGVLQSLTNNKIEYIILPEGKSKELVCNTTYSESLTKLKAVISSSNTDLVAYVKQAGSLAEARYLATGGSTDGTVFSPSQTGLKRVTLTGSLNASDISANTTSHFLDENGHWKTTSSNQKSVALWGEQGTIATIDLKDAVFATQTDMNFSYAGLSSLHDITLPTSASMTLIPAECFMGITTFNDLCIPYNYTKIDNAALLDTYCGHITTTDALNGAVVDNGEHSYTFSANLEEIGSKPSTADANGVYSLSRVVFPQNRGVTDVYVLAHNVPKCYANSFPANMLYGWGGFKGGDFPYCREKYDNSADGSMIFTVLHYPDEASYAKSSDKTGTTYVEMEKLYTDINKVYTKKEQTGAVDANGDPIAWPTFAELRRAYNQATAGAQWYDWNIEYDGQGSINGGNYIPVGTGEYTVVPTGTDPNTSEVDYGFSDYEGWHQFVLSMATYVEPAKTVENDVIKTNYVQGAWYTLCIPFSLTIDQTIELLGIPKSVDGKTENYLSGTLVDSDHLPDVRTLQTATRTPGATNTVTLKFTQNLLSEGITRYWNINSSDPDQSGYASTGSTSDGNAIAIRGGYPYLIRPYLPANEVVKNLGKYIMTRYGDKFEQTRSCIYIDGCAQDLAPYGSNQKTGRFAKPFEGHKIQAVWDDNNIATPKYRTHTDGKNYNYTFVGQFWTQKLPRYCFYMVENSDNTAGKWYRLASDKDYKWNQYKCVIMVTPENEETDAERTYLYTYSGKFRNNEHSIYPASTGTDAQNAYKFTDHLYIEFLNGLDDADFNEVAGARYVITFDDFIQDIDEDGNSTTAIESLDGELINKMPTDGKVYNLSGQLVGNSIDGLEKGMYIVNGKKYIVR